MKRMTGLMIVVVLCVFAFNAFAGDSASVTATAIIVEALSINKTQDLDFGTILPGTSNGTVVVAASNGEGSFTNCQEVGTNGTQEGAFDIAGQANTAYDINLPESATLSDGSGHSMTVNTFTTYSGSGNTTLSGSGTDVIKVGGTLEVAVSQAAGEYSGTFTVTIAYQ